MATLLSDIFAEASLKAIEASSMRPSRKRNEVVEEIRTLMSEARDQGIYYRDDQVDMVEAMLDQPKVDTTDLRELVKRFNSLSRCAEWVEAVTHKAEEAAAMDDGPDPE